MLLLVFATVLAGPVRAEGPADKREAKVLALQAIRLYHAGKPTEAYAKLEQAESLHQSVTHRVYLARCLDAMGRLVEADARYQGLADEPREPGISAKTKAAYQAAAKEHDALRERLPRLRLEVQGSGATAVKTVLFGEREVAYEGVESEIPVDPGPGEVRVEGEGISPASARFTAVEGEVATIQLMVEMAPDEAPAPPPTEGSLVPAFVAYGVGGAALVVGAITGGLSFAQAQDVKNQCVDFRCPADLEDDADRSRTLGIVSTVGFVVGGAAVAAGVVLTFVRPGADDESEARVIPLVGPGWLGLSGRF